MKKFTQYFFKVGLAIILIIIIKNVILFFTYQYDIKYLTKVKEERNIYNSVLNSYEGGYDILHHIKITLNEDHTGNYQIETYSYKIDGEVSGEFSFHSLLPYDKEKKEVKSYDLIWGKDYLKILESPKDTIFTKYKIIENKLYIDKNKHYTRYKSLPDWGFTYNKGLKFGEVFKFWIL